MFKKFFITLIFIIFLFRNSSAQVNLQNGSGNFSLPMFNWQDDKSRLNSIIALSYSSGNGLRVAEVPSNVGQGWSLIAGGVITRIQNGEPDDQMQKVGGESDLSKYPSGILYANVPAVNGYSTAITKYPIYGWKNQIYTQHNDVAEDKQLDYFSFQFNGKAGMFVLDPNNIGTAKFIGDSKMKINFQLDAGLLNQGIRTRITSFSIQDVDGLIYKFSSKGVTKVTQTNFCDEYFGNIKKQPKFKNDKVYYQKNYDNVPTASPFVVTNWYLSEIEDALTQRKIYFTYVTRNLNNIAGDDISINHNKKDYAIVSRKISIEQIPALVNISFPDGHSANFNYGAARADVNGDFALASVDILYQGRYLSRHELTTSYFILSRYGNPTTDYQKRMARLCLLSVRKIGVDLKEDTPPYKFDYYTGSTGNEDFVPPINTIAKDIWGYFNGNNSKGFYEETIPLDATANQINHYNKLKGLCYLRQNLPGQVVLNAKAGYAKNGLLKQIIYPTGGTLNFEYEQNTGVINGATVNAGGVHVSKTSSTDGGFSNDCNNPIITQYKYIKEANNQSSLWGLEMPTNKTIASTHYQPEYKTFVLRFGQYPTCDWKFKYPGLVSVTDLVSQTSLRNQAILSTAMNILNVLGKISDILKFASEGTGGATLIISAIIDLIETAIACIGDESRDSETTVYYNANLNSVAALPTQFKRVEVIENNGAIGKTVQEFTSDDDYDIWEPTNPVYSSKQRFAPWAYGLPKKTMVYDVNGNLVKSTSNLYSFSDVIGDGGHGQPIYFKARIPLNLKSAKSLLLNYSSQRNTSWSNKEGASYQTTSDQNMLVDIYDVYSGRVELLSTSEKVYKPNSTTDFVEVKTQYQYNGGTQGNNNFEPNLITTTLSNGDVVTKQIKYTSDYQSYSVYNGPGIPPTNYSAGILTNLNDNNLLTIPVSTVNSFFKNGETFYTNEKVTEFVGMTNGDIRPFRQLEQRFSKPQPLLIPGPNGGYIMGFKQYLLPGHPENPSYKQTQSFSYDMSGNLIGVKDEGNRSITNMYDYNDKYVVASVINADPSIDKVAYSSFETGDPETINCGNWLLTGTYITSNSAVTGKSSFRFLSGSYLRAIGLNTSKAHTVSFWSNTTTKTVTGGATLVKTGPTYNGFTYYEYSIAQGTYTVTVAGTGFLDELRLYPQTARMRTITYDPLIGKTLECDENNRITFYEYDNLGRLRFIKDEQKNVVKMYEYNNISAAKQNGCPGIYYNNYIAEKFIKSNCGTGYVGSEVEFTVPANTYSSLISQADADAKAENYILTNGQTYANSNGNCIQLYYNAVQSQNFVSESCSLGYIGGNVTYTVPYGRYSSTISQQDADEKALEDIEANGEWYANALETRNCVYNTDPVWEYPENGAYYCQSVNGEIHLFIQEININPNSSTYNNTRWTDAGPNELCAGGGGGGPYFNTYQSQTFTRNNCPSGYTGSSVLYAVAANTYSSNIDPQAANQLALNDISANGQNYANTNGTCTYSGCSPSNCYESMGFKCVYGQCEQGYRVNTDSYYDYGSGMYICVYHYEFSDGSWSGEFNEYNTRQCAIF